MELAQTCWRDIAIGHPADWELFRVIWEPPSWRCSFLDRYHQRMDLRWRTLDYVPDLDKMLERHREKEQLAQTSKLAGMPEGWRGTIRQVDGGSIVNAGTFFENTKQFVEVILVWPEQRDQQLENQIFQAMQPNLPTGGRRLWKAMGMQLLIDESYDVLDYKAEAGKLHWDMGKKRKVAADIEVERLAMPKYWLDTSLDQWLGEQVSGRIRSRRSEFINGHDAAVVVSSSMAPPLDTMLLRRKWRIDVAWHCQESQKVYRIAYSSVAAKDDIALPKHLDVICCRKTL